MSEELPAFGVSAAEGKQRIMVEQNNLSVYRYALFQAYVSEAFHDGPVDELKVMVSEYKMYVPFQLVKYFVPYRLVSPAEVTEMEYYAVFRNGLVPIIDERLIHLVNNLEWPLSMFDDIVMEEMGVRCKEHLMGREVGLDSNHFY